MIRDITLGQYYPADSVLHRLDPRVKLFGTLVYVVSLFLFQSFTGYIAATVFLVSMIVLSHVPVSFMFRGLKAVFILLIITAVLNSILTPGRELVSFWKITITIEGVRMAAFMVIRKNIAVLQLLKQPGMQGFFQRSILYVDIGIRRKRARFRAAV